MSTKVTISNHDDQDKAVHVMVIVSGSISEPDVIELAPGEEQVLIVHEGTRLMVEEAEQE